MQSYSISLDNPLPERFLIGGFKRNGSLVTNFEYLAYQIYLHQKTQPVPSLTNLCYNKLKLKTGN